MKLYLKQHVFTWGDRFTIYDEAGNDRYYVEGEVFSFGKKLHVYDLNNREVAFISQKFTWLNPRYILYRNGMEVAEVVKEFTFFRPKYTVEGLGWEVDGDFFDHEYSLTQFGRTIASVSKEWFTFGDAYEISIANGVDEITALGVVLVIDACIEAQRNN